MPKYYTIFFHCYENREGDLVKFNSVIRKFYNKQGLSFKLDLKPSRDKGISTIIVYGGEGLNTTKDLASRLEEKGIRVVRVEDEYCDPINIPQNVAAH